jgi:hypothetical protein
MIKNILAGIGIFLLGSISGCQQFLNTSVVHPRMREMAQETLDSSNNYMEKISSEIENGVSGLDLVNSLLDGAKMGSQKFGDQLELYSEITPELKGESLQRTEDCFISLAAYTSKYQQSFLKLSGRTVGMSTNLSDIYEQLSQLQDKFVQDCDL